MLKVAFRPEYHHPLPDGHRFPMEKYSLLPQQLLYEGTLRPENFFAPEPIAEADILAIHTTDYWERLSQLRLSPQEARKTGFPQSVELINRERIIMGGTIQCALFALQYGLSINIAGGTHHAYTDRGEGFCLLNDIALGASYLLRHGLASRILVVDLDVHQGNGTAQIFENEPRVFTFSMHAEANYPLHKEKSDLDIGLALKTGDAEYLDILEPTLQRLFAQQNPDFVFFQSGVDVLATDKLGHLGMSIAGCRQRDALVWQACHSRGIPAMACMGGGYSPQIAHIIEAHANTFRLAAALVG